MSDTDSTLIPFVFEDHDIRVVRDVDGDWSIVAKDVAESLEYTWQPAVIKHVPEKWKGIIPITTPGGVQNMLSLKEPGLYFFVSRSDKPKALPFQMWLAGDVVPAIRRTGSYSHPGFKTPRTFAEALRLAADQQELIEAQQNKIQALEPKAEYHDRLLGAAEVVDMEQAAKLLRTSRNRLFVFLREREILTKGSNLPRQEYIDKDMLRVQQTPYTDFWGNPKISLKTVFTQRGLAYIRGLVDAFGLSVTQKLPKT